MNYLEEHSWKYGTIWLPKTDLDTRSAIVQYGEYCESEVDVFRLFVKPGDTVSDGGASYGCHSQALAALGAHVYAFEPHPQVYEVLYQNSVSRIYPFDCGLGSNTGSAFMDVIQPTDHNAFQGIHQTNHGSGQRVSVVTLDEIAIEITDCTFIKLDIEGDEAKALAGGMQTITQFQPVIYLEFWWNQDQILNFLRMAGYREFWLHHPPRDRYPNFRNNANVNPTPGPPMLLALAERHLNTGREEQFRTMGMSQLPDGQ